MKERKKERRKERKNGWKSDGGEGRNSISIFFAKLRGRTRRKERTSNLLKYFRELEPLRAPPPPAAATVPRHQSPRPATPRGNSRLFFTKAVSGEYIRARRLLKDPSRRPCKSPPAPTPELSTAFPRPIGAIGTTSPNRLLRFNYGAARELGLSALPSRTAHRAPRTAHSRRSGMQTRARSLLVGARGGESIFPLGAGARTKDRGRQGCW
jgi:hypothetical protein